MHGSKPGPKPYLSAAEEEELAGHLIDAANILATVKPEKKF